MGGWVGVGRGGGLEVGGLEVHGWVGGWVLHAAGGAAGCFGNNPPAARPLPPALHPCAPPPSPPRGTQSLANALPRLSAASHDFALDPYRCSSPGAPEAERDY